MCCLSTMQDKIMSICVFVKYLGDINLINTTNTNHFGILNADHISNSRLKISNEIYKEYALSK